MGRPRMYCSALAVASKGVTLVYLPPEISVTDGRVLKMRYAAPFATAASAMRLPLWNSTSKLSGPKIFAEDGVRTRQRGFEGGVVEHVALDDFDFLLELLGCCRVDITGDGTDLVGLRELRVVQNIVDDRSTLLAGSAKDSKNFGHVRGCFEQDSWDVD